MGANINSINEATFKEWFLNTFDLADILEMIKIGPEHFGPFIYYSDTSMLYERFSQEIWDLAMEIAVIGCDDGVIKIPLQHGGAVDTPEKFESAMVLIAAHGLAYKLGLEALDIGIDDVEEGGAENE